MRWLKFLWGVLKDQRGWIWPVLAGVGSAILGSQSNKGEEEEDVYDPYASLRGQYTNYLSSKLGTSTPYKDNPAFNLETPEIESAAQKTVLGYLNNPTSNVKDYGEATKKYSEAAKASREIEYADEMKKTNDMYNRLGLVSSTPGLIAQGDLNRKQATEGNLFDADLMYKNLDRTLQAQGLDVSQLNSMLGQASNLGQQETGRTKFSKTMSMADIERMVNEEMGYGQLAAGVLGGNPPERTITTQGDDWMSILSKLLGSYALGG